MILKTRIFDPPYKPYKNLSQLAQAMGLSVSQVYRVRQGKRNINHKFIVGAMRAFPGHRFEDLFYFASEVPVVTNSHQYGGLVAYSVNGQAAEAKQGESSTWQTAGVK